jgi:hypothetical protein
MRTRILAAAVCLMVLAACGSNEEPQPSASATTSTSSTTTTTTLPPPGIDRFFAEITEAGYAERLGFSGEINLEGRDAILELADVVCDDIGTLGYESMVKVLMGTQAKPTEEEATAFIDSALRNICPDVRP